MNVPILPHQSTPLIQNGDIHPDWYQYLSQLTTELQNNFSNEGTAVPQQSTKNIATLEAAKPSPTFVYDKDLNVVKVAINGVFKTVTTT